MRKDLPIGVLVRFRPETDLKAEFNKVKEMNLTSCQLSVWDLSVYTDENAQILREAVEETGVTISGLWAGWSGPKEWNFTAGPETLGLVPVPYRAMRLKEMEDASVFAEKAGITDIITHLGFIPENPNSGEFYPLVAAVRDLANKYNEKGQRLLLETGQETPVTMLRLIQATGCSNIGINLDTANLILYGKANPLDALDVFGQYVWNTHCKDGLYPTDGNALGVEVPLGQGKAHIQEVIRRLAEIDYPGPLTIEREIRGDEQIRDIKMARDLILDTISKF